MGQKVASNKKAIWAHWEIGENGWRKGKNGSTSHFWAVLGHFSPISPARPKSFFAIFSPISGRRPKMVLGIATPTVRKLIRIWFKFGCHKDETLPQTQLCNYGQIVCPLKLRKAPTTCVKIEPLVLLAFFPWFLVFFVSKLDILRLKRSVSRLQGAKMTNGDFRVPRPKTATMPAKQGKAQQDRKWPEHMDWPQIGQKWQ